MRPSHLEARVPGSRASSPKCPRWPGFLLLHELQGHRVLPGAHARHQVNLSNPVRTLPDLGQVSSSPQSPGRGSDIVQGSGWQTGGDQVAELLFAEPGISQISCLLTRK